MRADHTAPESKFCLARRPNSTRMAAKRGGRPRSPHDQDRRYRNEPGSRAGAGAVVRPPSDRRRPRPRGQETEVRYHSTTLVEDNPMAICEIHGKDPQRCGAMAKHADAFRVRGRRCRNWPVPGRTRCRFHGGLSTGPKTPEGKAAVVAAMQEGRRRRIAELALEGKKINTGRRSPKPRASPEARRIVALIDQLAEERRAEEAAAAAAAPKRKRGRPSHAEELARFGVTSDEELIEKAKAALPALRHRLLGST